MLEEFCGRVYGSCTHNASAQKMRICGTERGRVSRRRLHKYVTKVTLNVTGSTNKMRMRKRASMHHVIRMGGTSDPDVNMRTRARTRVSLGSSAPRGYVDMGLRTFMLVTLSVASFCLSGTRGTVEKIKIGPSNGATRLYTGTQDGRVYTFHGLDTEDSSPPWNLRTLDEQQIQLMKTVRLH